MPPAWPCALRPRPSPGLLCPPLLLPAGRVRGPALRVQRVPHTGEAGRGLPERCEGAMQLGGDEGAVGGAKSKDSGLSISLHSHHQHLRLPPRFRTAHASTSPTFSVSLRQGSLWEGRSFRMLPARPRDPQQRRVCIARLRDSHPHVLLSHHRHHHRHPLAPLLPPCPLDCAAGAGDLRDLLSHCRRLGLIANEQL